MFLRRPAARQHPVVFRFRGSQSFYLWLSDRCDIAVIIIGDQDVKRRRVDKCGFKVFELPLLVVTLSSVAGTIAPVPSSTLIGCNTAPLKKATIWQSYFSVTFCWVQLLVLFTDLHRLERKSAGSVASRTWRPNQPAGGGARTTPPQQLNHHMLVWLVHQHFICVL